MKTASFIVGLFAVIIFVLSIQNKSKSKVLIFQLVANLLYGIQYLLINVVTAASMNFVSIFRCLVFYKYDKENKHVSKFWLGFILVVILIIGVVSVRTFLGAIPILISALYTISTWQNDMKVVRIVFTICSLFWMYYNINVGAYVSLIGNVFEFASGVISIVRFRKKKV